jgi:hypothetical protein
MASIWMLSKDAMRGMDIVGTISDVLDEFQTRGQLSSRSRDRVLGVIEKIIAGARSYYDTKTRIDSFSMITAEAAYTEISKPPSEFVSMLEECAECIRFEKGCQNKCMDLLRVIARSAMQATSRRVDTRSLILR